MATHRVARDCRGQWRLLAPHQAPAAAENVIYLSYVFWAILVLLAMEILAILLLRLILHKMPHQDMAVSSWLPLGPIGTGAMIMITLGNADFANFHGALAEMTHFAQMAGLMVALLWGFGLWWMCMAISCAICGMDCRSIQYGLVGLYLPLERFQFSNLFARRQDRLLDFCPFGRGLYRNAGIFLGDRHTEEFFTCGRVGSSVFPVYPKKPDYLCSARVQGWHQKQADR